MIICKILIYFLTSIAILYFYTTFESVQGRTKGLKI